MATDYRIEPQAIICAFAVGHFLELVIANIMLNQLSLAIICGFLTLASLLWMIEFIEIRWAKE